MRGVADRFRPDRFRSRFRLSLPSVRFCPLS